MKKVYLFSAIAVMAAVTACTKEPVNNQPDPEEGPVPVQFGLASPAYSVTTKSAGGLDAWNNTTLYVYGFVRTETDYNEAFIDNVPATAASGPNTSLDVNDAANNGNPYYYQGDAVYDFYGYHIDDAAEGGTPAPIVVDEAGAAQDDGTSLTHGVYIPFTINGSQDLMTATADPNADVGETGVDPTRAYSAYAARRGVDPTLTFQHQLARFKFQIKAGAASGMNVQVDAIEILNQKATGYLKVVGADQGITEAADDPGNTTFTLKEQGLDGMQDLTSKAPTTDFVEGKTQAADPIGESIMIFPGGESCKINIKTTNIDASIDTPTPIPDQEFTINASDLLKNGTEESAGATEFEAGKEYTITIIIYGPEDIEITAALTDWKDGGEVTLDPDDPQTGTGE